MNPKSSIRLIGCAALVSIVAACASEPPPPPPDCGWHHPTMEQMKIIHECAASKGVELPMMMPHDKDKTAMKGKMKHDMMHGMKHHHPMLTDEQKKVVDECFSENNIMPPSPFDHDGHDHQAPADKK